MKRWVFYGAVSLIILGGIVLIFYPRIDGYIAEKGLESEYEEEFKGLDIKENNANKEKEIDEDKDKDKDESGEYVSDDKTRDYKDEKDKKEVEKTKDVYEVETGVFEYDDVQMMEVGEERPLFNKKDVVGVVSVPEANFEMPIFYGVSHEIMLVGAGTMKPEQEMGKGNYALIGHNSYNPNLLFAPLKKMGKGDAIYVTDQDKVYKYKTVSSEVVDPSKIEVIDDVEDKELVTLISCYSSDGSDRIIVQGELEHITDFSSHTDRFKLLK